MRLHQVLRINRPEMLREGGFEDTGVDGLRALGEVLLLRRRCCCAALLLLLLLFVRASGACRCRCA